MSEMDKTKSFFLGAETYGSEIVEYLLKGKKVIINCGCANDNITGCISHISKYDKYKFTTTGYIFPTELLLTTYEYISSEEYDGNLFVYVS